MKSIPDLYLKSINPLSKEWRRPLKTERGFDETENIGHANMGGLKHEHTGWNVSVIDPLDRFAEMSQTWNDLLSRSFVNNIFLTWEWLYAWSDTYIKNSRRLFILKIEESGKLVGIAPWCIRRVKTGPFHANQLEFLGAGEGGSDYLDVIVKRGREEEVSRLLFHHIFNQLSFDWDVLSLKEISSCSIFLKHLTNEFGKSGKHYEIEECSYCPPVLLRQSVEEFDRGFSGHRRQQHSRHMRLLEKNNDVQRFHGICDELIIKDYGS